MQRFRTLCALSLILACTFASQCYAQPGPRLQAVEPRGLQLGATTTITARGPGLGGAAELLLPFPVETRRVDDGSKPNIASFEVTLPLDAAPGYFPLRIVTADGVSAAQWISVDGLANAQPDQDAAHQLPFAVTGNISGDSITETKFAGKADETITVEVEALRLGSKLRPVIELLLPDGNILAVGHGVPHWAGDTRLRVALPEDGTYTVRVHDVLYKGGRPGFYRLKIGDFPYADAAVPFAISKGGPAVQVTPLMGHISNEPVLATITDVAPGTHAMPFVPGMNLSGRPPQIMVRDEPIVSEQEASAADAPLAVPHGVNGVLSQDGESDTYRFAVQPGQKLRFETIAERAGLPLDSVLIIAAADGRVLANADDFGQTRDSRVDLDIPAGVTEIKVAVNDRMRRGGTEFAYYLSVLPVDSADFSLEYDVAELSVPLSSQTVFAVRANRRGYGGPIALSFSPPLSDGYVVTGDVIPAGADQTLLTITASETCGARPFVELIGEATIGDRVVQRYAARKADDVSAYAPWLARQLAIVPVRPRPIDIAWALSPEASSAQWEPAPGEIVPVDVTLNRGKGINGSVRLQLLTSQVVPLFESGPNQGKPQDAKAIRLAEAVVIPGDATTANTSLTFPNDLPMGTYDVALVAELLSADGKNVVERVMTPARRLNVIGPSLEISLDEPAHDPLPAVFGEGDAAVVKGRVKRTGGLTGPVSVSLVGLPEGWVTPEIQVPGDADEFELPLNLPFVSAAAAQESLAAALTGAGMAGGVDVLAKNNIALKLNVTAGAAPSLLPIFEDEANFVARLTEGGGQVARQPLDCYSGAYAVRVTPDQRFRTQLPGLKVAIKENPGPGEYRYLRFAWKKTGGANVLLQLHANGNWGPLPGANTPAFRYLAGQPRPDVAALQVSEELPGEWKVVTRDLFADFGEFQLDGIALTPGDGDAALFDHIYLAREEAEFERCPAENSPEQPLTLFEDDAAFIDAIPYGNGQATLVDDDRASGAASIKVTPDQRFNESLPGLNVKIRQSPGPGEYRFVRFAWKKQGGQAICVQFNHEGKWGVDEQGHKFRYHSGPGPECYGASLQLSPEVPADWAIVTRDLYADFGEFTLQGLALSPVDGEYGLFDQIYLGRSPRDFELIGRE